MLNIHKVPVNLSICSRANSLDCFVPRNDRLKTTDDAVIVNLTLCLRSGCLDCFVPRPTTTSK